MILINEMKLSNRTIESIGIDLDIQRRYEEGYEEWLDRVIEIIKEKPQ
jgi:hypothetical protein